MLSDNPNVSLKIVDCSLFTRRILVAEPNHQYLQWNLEKEPAQYNYMETIARTFIIPSRQNQCIQENVSNNAPIRRVAVAMNTTSAVAGSFYENPFNYHQFHLRELIIIRSGRAIISLDTTSPCRPYVTTMKAMQFNEDFPALPMEDFRNHYILVFDLTSLQESAEHLHYPELSGESLRLEMFFQFPLEQVTEVIVLGERLSNVQIFHLKLQYHTFYFFVLDINQLTFAKMDNFSLLQISEGIPELRFKYMGSYPSDKVPQLTKYFFAIVNSALSKDRGEHWIMMA